MKSRSATLAATLVGLGVAGLGLNAWREGCLPEISEVKKSGGAASGLRMLAADLAWLRMSLAWEECDLASTQRWLKWTSAVDPAPLYFWINGARILAYDLPEWRLAGLAARGMVTAEERERLVRNDALRALSRLDEAARYHPASAALWIERAAIELNRLGDVRAAAISFRRAAEQPDSPYFAARLHAELLRRLGEKAAALAWLVKLHPQLPPNDEAAAAGLVLARIRSLERELGVEADASYRSE